MKCFNLIRRLLLTPVVPSLFFLTPKKLLQLTLGTNSNNQKMKISVDEEKCGPNGENHLQLKLSGRFRVNTEGTFHIKLWPGCSNLFQITVTVPPPETNHKNGIEKFLVNKFSCHQNRAQSHFGLAIRLSRALNFKKVFLSDKVCYWILNIKTGPQITYLGVHAFYLLTMPAFPSCFHCTANDCLRDRRGQAESAGHRSVTVAALTDCGSFVVFLHVVLRCLPLRTCCSRSGLCMAVPDQSR